MARSNQAHYLNMINFFERRATDAAAESFNAKIKAFRTLFRGVRERMSDLQRLAKVKKKKRQPILLVCRFLSE